MRLVSLAWVLALAASTIGVAAETPLSNETLPAPIATRQTLFSIPFRVDRSERSMQDPVEVQLYVSADHGTNWQLYDRVRPEQARFLFRAVTDGEYWFAIGTRDRSGQLRPERADGPGLRVVVDTTLPELELQAQEGEAGEVIVRWQVTDPYLDLDSLKIQYRSDATHPWQSVAIDRQSVTASGPTRTGEVIWWPEDRPKVVEIRAEVADTAGNSAVSHAKVDLDRGALADSIPKASRSGEAEVNPPGMAGPPAMAWHASADAGNPPARPPEHSVAVDVNPAIRNQYPTPQQQADHTSQYAVPADQRPQMVNSRLFELDYHVDLAGPSRIGRVELWGTRDGGRTWTSFGVDNDNRSPMLVTVHEEGLYGFRVGVENGVGLKSGKPQSGDPPDVWIGVDLTEPTARILSAEWGTGDQAAQLTIRWEADDQMLSARPISLFYGATPGGPWSTIASGLENTGSYGWSVDRRLPEPVYLRLEVRDEAGNVGSFEAPEAVSLDPRRPVVRIRNVRPVVESAQSAPSRYGLR